MQTNLKEKILNILTPGNCKPGYFENKKADEIIKLIETELGQQFKNWLLEIKDKKI